MEEAEEEAKQLMEEAEEEAKQLMEEPKQLASVADRVHVVSMHSHCAYTTEPRQCSSLCLWLSKELEFISSNQNIASC